MTVRMSAPRTLVERASERLAIGGVASPHYDAEELLSYVLDVSRSRLGLVTVVSADQERRFGELVARRAAREPLQHLTGRAPFRHLELQVGPGVFIPRPETEVVAGWAIDTLRRLGSPAVVVDLCTGSGAIAASIADEVPTATVYAIELDPDAHAWAERNLAGSTVMLALGDAATAFPELDGTADLVIGNPPYIPLEAYDGVEQEVRDHDPALALWSGADGLDAIRVLEGAGRRLLRPGGFVVVEHADVQGESAPSIFAASGYWTEVRDHADLAGRPRYVTARRT